MKARVLLLTASLFLIGLSNLCAREWTDATGKHKVKAEFVDFKDGVVRLAKEDDKIISVPLDRLSAADQEYVHKAKTGSQTARNAAWNGKPRLTLKGHTKVVMTVAFSPDGETVATGSWDGTVKLWDAVTGRERTTLQAFKLGVNSVAFSPDGVTLAAGGWKDATVMRWNATTGRETETLPPTQGSYGINAVAISPDGETLAAACSDNTAKLWNLRTGEFLATLTGHTHFVLSVAFSPDGKCLATGSFFGKTVKLWDAKTAKEIATLDTERGPVNSLAFSPDGGTLATGSGDKIAELWDVEMRRVKTVCRGHTGKIETLAFSPDGKLLATGACSLGSPAEVKLWDPQTGKELAALPVQERLLKAIAFSPDGKTLATSGLDKTVKCWDVAQITSRLTIEKPTLSPQDPERTRIDTLAQWLCGPDAKQRRTRPWPRGVLADYLGLGLVKAKVK